MIIYNPNNEVLLDIPVDDDSFRYRAVMQEKKVSLHYSLPGHVELPMGAYIEYQGERYTLRHPGNFKKMGTRAFEYTVEFGGDEEILKNYKFKLLVRRPYQLKFSFTAKPELFLKLLVDNLNLYDAGWSVGRTLEATEKTLSFNHESCFSVLSRLASEFNTEWEITGKTIHLGKVEKFKTEPLALSYGRGNGFLPGVGRAAQGDKQAVTVLYVQGGDKNLPAATYGSPTLLLPRLAELVYEGRRYQTDADGMYITRADKPLTVYQEDSFDASHIYPSRLGTVTGVETVPGKDTEGNPVVFYNVVDTTIPDSLDYRACRIKGEKATLIFQSGLLTGREFDLEQTDEAVTGYDPATKTFRLAPLREGDAWLPNEGMAPAVGDTYAIFHISLPAAYVSDDATRSGASWDMFREAVRYFYEHEQPQFTFKGELDGIWAKKHWLEIGGKLVPGGYVDFSDTQFQPEGVAIRITSVTDYLNKPHSPTIELSNTPVGGFASDQWGKLDADEVKNERLHRQTLSYTQRRFRDLEETGRMLEEAVEGFSAAIDPIYIQTMSLQVGSEALQFRFVTNKTMPQVVEHEFTYASSTKVFATPGGIIQHMTLGIKEISTRHKPSDYRFWDLAAYTSPPLDDPSALYLYARCSKSGSTGTFLLSKTAFKLEAGDAYYFLVGTLSSEVDGVRSFVTVYGFTEILPGRITTDKIVSADGVTYFNLQEGVIGGRIRFAEGSSGYDQLADKPDLGIYGTTALLNTVKDNLQNQLDNKIETYYGTSNPWNAWPSTQASRHVGDLWYNTDTKVLMRYVGPSADNWAVIRDSEAIKAAEAASHAQDTADGKRRVFLETPRPPYDEGDQWLTKGASGDMYICIRPRSTGNYARGDWALTSADGNITAAMDRGISIAHGFVAFGGPNSAGAAGLMGEGSIRIWSGGTNANTATFQVYATGDVAARSSIRLQDNQAGITGGGEKDSSVRFWAGGFEPEAAPFRVTRKGELTAIRGRIGGFNMTEEYLSALSGTMDIKPREGIFFGRYNSDVYAALGGSVLPSATGVPCCVYLKNASSSGVNHPNGYTLLIQVGNSINSDQPQQWINCNHSAGWGSGFTVESRYFNDANGMERTVINVGALARKVHMQALNSSGTWRRLVVNDITGYIAYED